MTKSLSYCEFFKDKYNRRYGLVSMVGYGVPVQGCTGGFLKNKVMAIKTPGFPTVLRPRTYTNIIGYQLLSVTVTTVTKKGHEPKATNQKPRTIGHEPKATYQRPRIKGHEPKQLHKDKKRDMYTAVCMH